MYTRWIEPQGWAKTKAAFFADLPGLLRWLVPPMARRGMAKELHGHGMGRHQQHARQYPQLQTYCARMRDRYYS